MGWMVVPRSGACAPCPRARVPACPRARSDHLLARTDLL